MRPDDEADPDSPTTPSGHVVAVARAETHAFSKPTRRVIRLLEGLGVEGDAHAGTTVQHLSRKRDHPSEPNLRQVHLLASELFDDVRGAGHDVTPGALGENVTTAGVDLLGLPLGTVLELGSEAAVELTGLRNPCRQIQAFQPGLLQQVLGRGADGSVRRRTGVMSVVRRTGEVRPGDPVRVLLPPEPHRPLRVV
jgi:MOSC domain-containing protein YiiM